MKKLGFVIPWFAKSIPGGAEAALRGLTRALHASGVALEILTTRVKEFTADWNTDYYPEGVEMIDGICVRRFSVRQRDTAAFDQVNYKLMCNIPLAPEEEDVFLWEMVNSPDLYAYMDAHQAQYSLFVFIPYMFGTTYYGMQVCPEKSVMIPCFHREQYIELQHFKALFPRAAGMIFHAQPESDLAHATYDLSKVKTAVLGTGLDTDVSGCAARFREKYQLQDPFILYAGRKDAGKNIHALLNYMYAYKHRHLNHLKLVLIGGGEIEIPARIKQDVIDLGFVPVQDKYDAYSAATLLCQPSKNESFSLVIMESWLCGRPVLVHQDCAVTRHFAADSNGGLYFANYLEFEGGVDYILYHSDVAAQMGANGRAYVLSHFAWPVVVARYMAFFRSVCAPSGKIAE
nr:glycosyltransferase family 4 protein [Maliibacterium massiliense]